MLERRICNTKREVMGLNTARQNAEDELKDMLEADYQRKVALLQKQNKAYNDFCKEHDLKKLNDRISIAQWDRKQAAQARAAAKKRIDSVGEDAATSNWHSISVAGGQTDTKYRMITEPKSIDQNIALTNPGYKNGGPAYRQNCQRGVPAYEMRRRGYDVIAKPATVNEQGKISTTDALYYQWKNIFKDADFEVYNGYDGVKAEIISQMKRWGESTVAEVRVLWKNCEAHVFVAKHINGIVRFIDPQSGDTNCERYFTNAALGGTMMARIDNLEPSELIILCIKNRGGKT